MTDFDLRDAISKACVVAGVEAETKRLRLDIRVRGNVPRFVRGDNQRVRKIISSLVSNAVKFTPAGSVGVDVDAPPRGQAASRTIRVVVADTGIGVDPQMLERMFEPFTQADASTTRNHGGIGLGLAIARELVELMGGTIGARSEPGHGSTFWFELDLDLPKTRDGHNGHHRAQAFGAQSERTPLVLVAEDSRVNQIVAVRALERCGCRAAVVGDGRQALEALSTRHFDAVLMDCHMPAVDGYQATTQLRRREHSAEHTPVIAMSARAMKGDREHCFEAGMDDCICKPMHHDALAQVLRRWIPALAGPANALTATQGADTATNTHHPNQDQAVAGASRCGPAGPFLRPARWRPGLHLRSELEARVGPRSA
jgi:CheY-like chemotaxis protein